MISQSTNAYDNRNEYSHKNSTTSNEFAKKKIGEASAVLVLMGVTTIFLSAVIDAQKGQIFGWGSTVIGIIGLLAAAPKIKKNAQIIVKKDSANMVTEKVDKLGSKIVRVDD